MEIVVMNRQQAIEYCHQPHDEKVAMISIYTPIEEYHDEPFMSTIIGNGVEEILRLGFFDIDNSYPSIEGKMTIDDAELIVDMVERNMDKKIIVHCDAGQSRSTGIAAALSRFYNGDDSEYFNNPEMAPNHLCYDLVLVMLTGSDYEEYRRKE